MPFALNMNHIGFSLRIAAMLLLGCMHGGVAHAQSFTNPGFESGSTGWAGCPLELNPANVYGGPNTSMVAEVDGHNDPNTTTDDRVLCQTVSGFTVGAVYALEFDAVRRQTGPTPTSVSVTITIDNVLNAVITRTGGWNMQRQHLTFTATSTSHALQIRPNFTGSHGMILDNFGYVLVSPLPVELLYFDARPVGQEVILDWATATEHQNAGFTIERSQDLHQWEDLVHTMGSGDSQSMIVYQARDPRPFPGTSYYRLRQFDFDGTATLSDVRAVEWNGGSSILVWPNPARSEVQVHTDGPVQVKVFNAMGQEVQVPQQRTDLGALLSIEHLPSGHYYIRPLGPMGGVVPFIRD
jgi:hypothetical protein